MGTKKLGSSKSTDTLLVTPVAPADVAGVIQTGKVTANITNATTTLANATGMSFAVANGETWLARIILKGRSTVGATGIKVAFTIPTATAANCQWYGNTTGITAYSTQIQSTLTVATTVVFWGLATTDFFLYGDLYFLAGATGTIQLQYAALGASTTIQLSLGSFLVAFRG